ncbi:GTP-binding protein BRASSINAZOLE INSENSITIVE PALE GREEN 2, chloroplastic [Citrus sinensis]|uniref:GTP-binding protein BRASSINAZOLE INSENSITIVE PALE GREEN 2, chloroplastic n=1 Tax=Citrus clementina TaxID=85681 RepID=UPI000CECFD3A|nr:GTP-binding protein BRASSINAZOLE INSENSITIVE PALE GREEN 2, chloroplastic [Citrus x clementina]XP_052289464.1 GTP-binding protein BRASSINAZOLE INSENSITIVE PALE GREEN 2, chloroplastic [Citrus sinensis]
MAVLLSTTITTTLNINVASKPEIPETKFDFLAGNFTSPLHFPSLFNTCLLPNLRNKKRLSLISLAVKKRSNFETTVNSYGKINKPGKGSGNTLILSEGRDEDEHYGPVCPGCGIFMQDKDPNLPGYYKKKKVIERNEEFSEDEEGIENDVEGFEEDIVDGNFDESDRKESDSRDGDVFDDWDSDEWEAKFLGEDEDDLDLDGFTPAGVGYGNITEELIERSKKKKLSKAEKKKKAREAQKEKGEVTVCARCHSLRNYGQVKNEVAENLIPDFDFDRVIATRLLKPSGNANAGVVVMVVDCVDFDGMFPKQAAKSLFKKLEEAKDDAKLSKKLPKLVLVGTKVDLLPSQVSPTRLDRWVRHRAKAGGAPKLNGVYLVSARKDLGVRNLLAFIKELAGPRGNVWVVGSQNAGKSTLINTFAKKEGVKVSKLTEAPIPGTTLGILRIGGILPAKAKLYDTPGLLHPHLMSMRLNRDEQKMVEIRKELQPRTYRVKARQAVHVGGLMRLDLDQASVETIYVTVWASPNVSLHLGKIENADEIWKNHVGIRLQPPIGQDRASEIGTWKDRKLKVSGTSWDVNSIDIAAAGLGWFSLGLKGEASLTLWTYDGIEITLREPLILDRAPFLERPGFWLPKAISDALGSKSKLEAKKRKKLEETEDFLSEVSDYN